MTIAHALKDYPRIRLESFLVIRFFCDSGKLERLTMLFAWRPRLRPWGRYRSGIRALAYFQYRTASEGFSLTMLLINDFVR